MQALHEATMTIIPSDLLLQLYARKLEANQQGGWREGHRTNGFKRKQKQKSQKSKGRRRGK
jgi:hypothetical protein